MTPAVSQMLEDARRDPQEFWDRAARQLPWFHTWERVFDPSGTPEGVPYVSEFQPEGVPYAPEFRPAFRWFAGARTNLAYNALDVHVASGRGDHTALIYFNERGERRLFTYAELLREVERVAAALRALGVG